MQSQWDLETQEFHGGQSWRGCKNFIADFSVTTNAFGAPLTAIQSAAEALTHVHHYPSADATEARQAISKFCNWQSSRMLIGNGASEFIDLLMKTLPSGPFTPAPYIATYQEYHRAARAAGRHILQPSPSDRDEDALADAAVSVYIRPNSPTGDCISLDRLAEILKNTTSHIIVDESFLPFAGPKWRELSALNLVDQFPDRLIIVQSWTKVWSCAGLRLGTVCASSRWITDIKRLQTPWSCNSLAQKFAIEASKDTEYMENTWNHIPQWRRSTIEQLRKLGWKVYQSHGDWIPWVLAECPSKEIAATASKAGLAVGCPIRHCASYGLPKYVRVAVRRPEHQDVLFQAWRNRFLGDSHAEKN